MSRENVEQSLAAAEQALTYFVDSLDRAGFAQGASAYQRMAQVIVGQWLWAEQQGVRDLEPKFLSVAALAGGVADRLQPYVQAMNRLNRVRGLASVPNDARETGLGARVLAAITASTGGLSVRELSRITGASAVDLRAELKQLAGAGALVKPASRTGRYQLAGTGDGD